MTVFIDLIKDVVESIFFGDKERIFFKVIMNKRKVGRKVVGDGRGVFIAVNVVGEARDNHEGKENGERKDGEDTGIGVRREETVPFF